MTDAPRPLLAVNNIEVIYDHVILVLKGVSLAVPEGGIVALLGANGAGKSTTLKAISGLLRTERGDVTKGSIEFRGEPIRRKDPSEVVRRGIVQVMEGRHVFEHLTVEENLLTGAYTQRDGRAIKRDLEKAYEYFPRLRERRGARAGYVSGGEQQMVAIGRALMAHPKLMLLDEPSMGLAPMLVQEIFEIVSRLNREEGVSVLLAEQNALIALRFADYAYVMENGRVVLDGDRKSISENEDIKEFYLGLSGVGQRKSYRDVKHYKRREAVAVVSAQIEIREVSKSFGGVQAVSGVSLDVNGGEITSVIGPNGAGKTTVLNMISGFYHPDRGRILLDGADITDLSPSHVAARGVARTFQNIALFKGMTVLDNLMLGRHVRMKSGVFSAFVYWGLAQKEEVANRRRIEELIDFLKIQDLRRRPTGSLAYGLQKRVELGRALALDPKVLLLDEPMGGMNQEEKEDMARFILDVNEEWGTTIILIEHDMGVVMDISDRVAVLDMGQKIAEGTPDEVKANPRVIKAYLGEAKPRQEGARG